MKLWDDCTIKERIERWQKALEVMQSMTRHERKHHWDMGTFGKKTDCGTVACLAGTCSLIPWFRRRGFKADWLGARLEASSGGFWCMSADFFGNRGAHTIMFNTDPRPVHEVILEVRRYIKEMQREFAQFS